MRHDNTVRKSSAGDTAAVDHEARNAAQVYHPAATRFQAGRQPQHSFTRRRHFDVMDYRSQCRLQERALVGCLQFSQHRQNRKFIGRIPLL